MTCTFKTIQTPSPVREDTKIEDYEKSIQLPAIRIPLNENRTIVL
jgi:hypothetical protein